MDAVIRRALPADARALTRVAHAAKRHWKYPEDWIRRWRDALTVTRRFVEHHPIYGAVRGARLLGFYALSGVGPTRELEHFWVAPEQIGRGVGRADVRTDRKSTRLNSSHVSISYAVFCLKK